MLEIQELVASLGNSSKLVRKTTLKAILEACESNNSVDYDEILNNFLYEICKSISDESEACRELSIKIFLAILPKITEFPSIVPVIISALKDRIVSNTIIEPSEEIRFLIVQLLKSLIDHYKKVIISVSKEMVISLLSQTICDPFHEVQTLSCQCTRLMIKYEDPGDTECYSKGLLKCLLKSTSHCRRKVRSSAIYAIGDVVEYGNNSDVNDVVSHLAQRLFDDAPDVRLAVAQVAGRWLSKLPERYSYFRKILPIVLSLQSDENLQVREEARKLWDEAGKIYEFENEEMLENNLDWISCSLNKYPIEGERPRLGCRVLCQENFSFILSGILNDISDWIPATRIKSAELFYTLLLHEENQVTQYLSKVLEGLKKSSKDEEKLVVVKVLKCAELLGYFCSPSVWKYLILPHISPSAQDIGTLHVLTGMLKTSRLSLEDAHEISQVLCSQDVCYSFNPTLQSLLLSCIKELTSCQIDDKLEYHIFFAASCASAICPELSNKSEEILKLLSLSNEKMDLYIIYKRHTKRMLLKLMESIDRWTISSHEHVIAASITERCGPVVGEMLENVIALFKSTLNQSKSSEIQLKFFMLLSNLLLTPEKTIDSVGMLHQHLAEIVQNILIPNLAWKVGHTASTLRTAAVACVWALLKGLTSRPESTKNCEFSKTLMERMLDLLYDESAKTRRLSCKVLSLLMHYLKDIFVSDFSALHAVYPILLQSLEDSDTSVRMEAIATFNAYAKVFPGEYDGSLFEEHLKIIYKGLLLHMDDSNERVRTAILDALKVFASVHAKLLLKETEYALSKNKHHELCDLLLGHIKLEYLKK